MSRVERFEDLIALQKARVLAGEIYRSTRTSDFSRDFGLVNQIRRAAVCVLRNLAEGFERGGRAERKAVRFPSSAARGRRFATRQGAEPGIWFRRSHSIPVC